MRYRRMRAALVILQAYRRYKVKSYVREVNRRFRNVGSMKDRGRHVKWPTPPKVLRKLEEALKSIYNRYTGEETSSVGSDPSHVAAVTDFGSTVSRLVSLTSPRTKAEEEPLSTKCFQWLNWQN